MKSDGVQSPAAVLAEIERWVSDEGIPRSARLAGILERLAGVPEPVEVTISQARFAGLVGLSEARVSQLVSEGVLEEDGTGSRWIASYCRRLRDQAAGRDSDGTLAKERSALARSQRLGQDIRNAKELGEWAPIGLLGDVLALASSAVTDRFDALPGQLRRTCPAMPVAAWETVQTAIASARAEWIRSTAQLVDRALDEITEDGSDEAPSVIGGDDDSPI